MRNKLTLKRRDGGRYSHFLDHKRLIQTQWVKDKAWFNEECKWAYLAKQETSNLE